VPSWRRIRRCPRQSLEYPFRFSLAGARIFHQDGYAFQLKRGANPQRLSWQGRTMWRKHNMKSLTKFALIAGASIAGGMLSAGGAAAQGNLTVYCGVQEEWCQAM